MVLTLAHQVFGEGPPLVILHGLFGSGRNWSSLAKRMAQERRVYTLDMRNHGESPWSDDVGYPAMAEDVRAFLDDQGLDDATIVGHSMGGKAAMALALAHPDRVKALVVVDIAPVTYASTFRSYIVAMQSVDLGALTKRSDADEQLKDAVPDRGVRSFLLQNLAVQDGQFSWKPNLVALGEGMEQVFSFPQSLLETRYGGPTLFIAGGASEYIQDQHHGQIRDLFPQASIEVIAGAGHWVHAENPSEFLAKFNGFLDR